MVSVSFDSLEGMLIHYTTITIGFPQSKYCRNIQYSFVMLYSAVGLSPLNLEALESTVRSVTTHFALRMFVVRSVHNGPFLSLYSQLPDHFPMGVLGCIIVPQTCC